MTTTRLACVATVASVLLGCRQPCDEGFGRAGDGNCYPIVVNDDTGTDDTGDTSDTADTDTGDTGDTGDTADTADTGDTGDTGSPEEILTYDGGTATYTVTVDGATVCSSAYALTGTEYENGFCQNCSFMFSLVATETARDDDHCPDPDPWRYTLSVPYPDAYPDHRSGLAYTEHWYYAGYGYLPGYELFFSFYHYGPYVYDYEILSARIEGSSGTTTIPGTFADADGSVTWSHDPDPVYGARAAEFRNCTDTFLSWANLQEVPGDFSGDEITPDNPTADGYDFASTPDGTLQGTLAECSSEERADAYTFTVGAGATAHLSVDVDPDKGFDPFLWVDDATGCTVRYSDNLYKCNDAVFTCHYVDGDGNTQAFSCCPSVEIVNGAGSAATYTAWVGIGMGDACDDESGDVAGYVLKYEGTSGAPVADATKDDYHPKYESSASGTTTYTRSPAR